jgi:ATP-binding cassette, subfamily B, bacterial
LLISEKFVVFYNWLLGFFYDLRRTFLLVWNTQPIYTILLALLSIIQGGIPVIQLWISKLVLDSIVNIYSTNLGEQLTSTIAHLFALIIILGCITLFTSSINSVQTTTYALLGDLLSNQINLKILEKANRLDLSFYENATTYDRMQNAYQQANSRPLGIITQIFSFIQTLITLLSITYLLSQLNWIILPIIFITTIPMLIAQKKYGQQNYWMLRERTPDLRMQSYLNALLTNDRYIKEIRIFHLENYFVNKSQVLFKKFFSETRTFLQKKRRSFMCASLVSSIGWFISAIYVVVQAIRNLITIGDFSLFLQSISTAQTQLLSLVNLFSSVYSDSLFIRNLFEFLDIPNTNLAKGTNVIEKIEEIEFLNVSFCYPQSDIYVLKNISFRIKKGQSLAIVGKNGAGKTTLIKLMCKLYEPTSGQILINGKPISEYCSESVQEKISVLFQDFAVFFLTARENIGVGSIKHITDLPSIKCAAQKGGADSLIEKLDEKYETNLGKWFDGGINLSGGEWQKIALSRAYMRKSDLFILDEPTSALDAEAELETFEQILKDKKDKITLLISHRFSTVRLADNIIVIENGSKIEYGTHEMLMELGGHYANLYDIQAKGFKENRPIETL